MSYDKGRGKLGNEHIGSRCGLFSCLFNPRSQQLLLLNKLISLGGERGRSTVGGGRESERQGFIQGGLPPL